MVHPDCELRCMYSESVTIVWHTSTAQVYICTPRWSQMKNGCKIQVAIPKAACMCAHLLLVGPACFWWHQANVFKTPQGCHSFTSSESLEHALQ